MKNSVLVFDDVCETALIKRAYDQIVKRGGASYKFTTLSELWSDEDQTLQAVKKVVHDVWYNKLYKHRPENIFGYEIWHNVMYEGGNLDLHTDCDESSEKMVCPSMSCVIYCGPDDRIGGGQLLIDTTGQNDFEVINYRYNRVVLFDSSMPHQVNTVSYLPNSDQPRVAISCPAWDHEIKPKVERY